MWSRRRKPLPFFIRFLRKRVSITLRRKLWKKKLQSLFCFFHVLQLFLASEGKSPTNLDHSESFPLDQATPSFHAFVLLNSSKQSIAKIPPKFKHVQFGPCVAQKCGFVKLTFLYFVICLRLFVCFHVFSCTVLKVIKCLLWHNYWATTLPSFKYAQSIRRTNETTVWDSGWWI